MNKQELMKKCNEIILATNGGNDDYVVALCRISEAVSKLEEPSREECEFNFIEEICPHDQDYDEEFYQCSKCEKLFLPNAFIDDYNFCPNCGAKIKREKRDD